MFHYVDLIWTGLVTLGGFLLLIDHEKELNKTNWIGVLLIFIGFLFQIYWEFITAKDWINVIGISIIVIVGTCILYYDIKSKSPKVI